MDWRVLLVAVFFIFPLYSPAQALPEGNPHDFRNRCRTCHLVEPRAGEKQVFTGRIDDLCNTCHQMRTENSHPSKITTELSIPRHMPLDEAGEMTCATCHDPHGGKTGHLPFLLRVDAHGEFLCQSCHELDNVSDGLCMVTSGIAHVKTSTPPDSMHFSQNLDRISLNCLACHGTTSRKDTPYHESMPSKTSVMGAGFVHPIGSHYADTANRSRGYREPEQLSPLIALYEGKVGCFSCHNPFSTEKSRLVMKGGNSHLCLECHLK